MLPSAATEHTGPEHTPAPKIKRRLRGKGKGVGEVAGHCHAPAQRSTETQHVL